MPKQFQSYKDITISLRHKQGVFMINLCPIGGGQLVFKTKAEGQAPAKELFDIYLGCKPETVVSKWTIEDAFNAFTTAPP